MAPRAFGRVASGALRAAGVAAAGRRERRRREQRVELLVAPARAADSEHDLDEDLFAPFAHLCLDHRPGAGDSAVAVLPVADQVGDRAEVSVDGQLVAFQVVAGGLIFEVARSRGIRRGWRSTLHREDRRRRRDQDDHRRVLRTAHGPIRRGQGLRSPGSPLFPRPADSFGPGAGSQADRRAHRRRRRRVTRWTPVVAVEPAGSGSVDTAA